MVRSASRRSLAHSEAWHCGAFGVRVTAASELDDALMDATAHHGPALVELLPDAELVCGAPQR
jgi:thiamine pyrophosphate-dependent acetolactate synthase large subunit-like protein